MRKTLDDFGTCGDPHSADIVAHGLERVGRPPHGFGIVRPSGADGRLGSPRRVLQIEIEDAAKEILAARSRYRLKLLQHVRIEQALGRVRCRSRR